MVVVVRVVRRLPCECLTRLCRQAGRYPALDPALLPLWLQASSLPTPHCVQAILTELPPPLSPTCDLHVHSLEERRQRGGGQRRRCTHGKRQDRAAGQRLEAQHTQQQPGRIADKADTGRQACNARPQATATCSSAAGSYLGKAAAVRVAAERVAAAREVVVRVVAATEVVGIPEVGEGSSRGLVGSSRAQGWGWGTQRPEVAASLAAGAAVSLAAGVRAPGVVVRVVQATVVRARAVLVTAVRGRGVRGTVVLVMEVVVTLPQQVLGEGVSLQPQVLGVEALVKEMAAAARKGAAVRGWGCTHSGQGQAAAQRSASQ